jgi:excisionase family DNA binding protein
VNDSKYLDVKAAAAELSISPDQLKKLIFSGDLPAVDVGIGSRSFWRVARTDLEAWLTKRHQATARRFGGDAA